MKTRIPEGYPGRTVTHRTEPYTGTGYFELLHTGGTMSDDLNNRGQQDRIRINVNEEHEVRYWTQELGVTREELEQAVKTVGVMVEDVRKHLET